VFCAREFAGNEPFLHMIGDHVYVSANTSNCAAQLVEVARQNSCAVSAVQPTRENLLPFFGTVGGTRVKGSKNLYQIESVVEKPTPTEAEQSLMVPGLRTGHYLCFFGMHVLTPAVMEILAHHVASRGDNKVALSPVLAELAGREKYLAYEAQGRRYPLDERYGLLSAQLALALSGRDRDEVLSGLCELLAQKNMESSGAPQA
jgi:UTP--glucose-1-phosphate uridylyltransferase